MRVSCILPTKGRRSLASKAIQYFMSQTHQDKELVILDDLENRSFPNGQGDLPRHANILYFLNKSRSIAEKRNLCCEYAFGELIITWDSDDYSAPERIAQQVAMSEQSGKAVIGYCSMLFYDERDGRAWKYVNSPNYGAVGTSLCYRRDFWRENKFRLAGEIENVGEDGLFVKAAINRHELYSVDAGDIMVARIHSDSTSPHNLSPSQMSYRSVPIEALPPAFFA
jgi:glycosyltransferase involved in cell wall biosynthesis